MAEIARLTLDFADLPACAWDRIASHAAAWLAERQVPPRDAVLLLPLAQHLTLARQAWARLGGWMPRIETLRTLSATCAPQQRPAGAISFDVAHDRLRARQMLREANWSRQWAERDPRGFEQTLGQVVDCAHRLGRRAAALPPDARSEWEMRSRAALAPADGPGGLERLLARLALEWVAASSPWPDDRLFALRPGGLIVLQAGGADPMLQGLLDAARHDLPCLLLDADTNEADPLQAVPPRTQLRRLTCEDFEDEAEQAAAQLLALLQRGAQPLALIAQDRVLVRRVSALLARQQVPVLDETGWKLSTTRAAAGVMALLRASAPQAGTDDLLDWLKALPESGQDRSLQSVDALERALRRAGCTRRAALEGIALPDGAAVLRGWAEQCMAGLGSGRATLAQWTRQLAKALQASGQWQALQDDAAGVQLIAALHLETADAAWRTLAEVLPMRWPEFVQSVDEALEQAVFVPPAPATPPAVVITPLRRALLRPFAAAVLPGADDRRLGVPAAPDALLGETTSIALGLPSVADQQRQEALALAQLLRVPQVLLSFRRQDDGEPLEASLLLERLALRRERAGAPIAAAPDARIEHALEVKAQPRPAPRAGHRLPAALSASAVEALRDCPYRFFARSLLRLQEAEELDEEAEKRDYGNWLHAVLLQFHAHRPAARPPADDLAALRHWAQAERAQAGLDDASFLPFEASFERFAPHYIVWLQQRDAAGAQWLEGETERHAEVPELEGVALKGRIDRVDLLPGNVRQLIDYKTVPLQSLRQRVREPLEDTQLAFYAALEMLTADVPELEAAYLALDDSDGVKEVPHADVQASAQVLLRGLADELRRLRGGATLPALGEGAVCEHCEARGLCRRDHWAEPQEPPQ